MILSDVGRTIDAATTSSDTFTLEKCIEFCDDQGFAYAGAEYHGQCCKFTLILAMSCVNNCQTVGTSSPLTPARLKIRQNVRQAVRSMTQKLAEV